jgi:hypothetical protein
MRYLIPLAVKFLVVSCVALVAVPAPALAADWRLSASRPTQWGSSLAFLDAASIRGGNGRVTFETFTFFDRATGGMNRVKALVAADCATMAFGFRQLISFHNKKALGQWSPSRTADARPVSNLFDQIRGACGISDLGMHVDNPEAFSANYFARHSHHRSKRWRL